MTRLLKLVVPVSILALLVIAGITASSTNVAQAAKPQPVIKMSNGYPSGHHFNFNLHGKKNNFLCPEPPYGASAFIPEYGLSTVEFVASKRHDVDKLTVIDACDTSFPVFEDTDGDGITPADDQDPVRVQLPKTGIYSEGFWVFGRVLAKPKNKDGEASSIMLYPNPNIRVCNDGESDLNGDGLIDEDDVCPAPDNDLMPLGLVTNEGAYTADGQELKRPKGKVTATDITDLFTWTGYVCDAALDTNGNGVIDEGDVPNDLDGDGDIDPDDLAIWLGLNCEFHNTEWVFNVADLVIQDQDIDNNGAKLFKVRFYPVATTQFAPTSPTIKTQLHAEPDETLVNGGTAAVGTSAHASAILSAGTGPLPEGTVSFAFYTNGTCDDTDPADFLDAGTVPIVDGVAHPSASQSNLGGGAYSFSSHYNGDDPSGSYVSAQSSCEPLVIGNPASVATEIHLSDHTVVTSVVASTTVHPQATVIGSAGTPAGTVTFAWFDNETCTGTPITTSGGVSLDGGGVSDATSFPQVPATAGQYSFQAHYNGEDANYFPSDGACQPLEVT